MYTTEFFIFRLHDDIIKTINLPYKVKVGDKFYIDIYDEKTCQVEGCIELVGGYSATEIEVKDVMEIIGRNEINIYEDKEEYYIHAFCEMTGNKYFQPEREIEAIL